MRGRQSADAEEESASLGREGMRGEEGEWVAAIDGRKGEDEGGGIALGDGRIALPCVAGGFWRRTRRGG